MIDPEQIVAVKVYPPIGIARVGNAKGQDDYVVGPEVIGGPSTLPGSEAPAQFVNDFRSANGEIKRQAARFRVYAHMKDGSVQEVTADLAEIEWRVAVANLKSGWYEFNQAMDLGPQQSKDAQKRNRDLLTGSDRSRLDIVPAPQTIAGSSAPAVPFDDGIFWDKPVYLGELRTDAEGRLIFLGGMGDAQPFRKETRPLTFANNVGWHDDVCDGPVRATVTFRGHDPFVAEPGYVAVAPPNYAPGLFGLVTADDAVREVFYAQSWLTAPVKTSFTDDVLPLFRRLTGLQWVNHGLFILHGFGSPLDVQNNEVKKRLNDNSPANEAWRMKVLALFRDPNAGGTLAEKQLPQVYGDAVDAFFDDPTKAPATAFLAVTKAQYAHLTRWAAGNFDSDWSEAAPEPTGTFSELTPDLQVQHLERASLHDCLGGPFHPAMELTWVIRIPRLWKSAYRLNVLPGEGSAKQDFGEKLTPTVCIGPDGPYNGAAAGCLTRFLGVPWHTDHTSCNSAADYSPSSFLSMPTFWGPRAPDQVLAEGNFLRATALTEKNGSEQQIFKHLMHRVDWLRDIRGTDYYDRLSLMIKEWAELGMVLPVEGISAEPVEDLRVEQGRNHLNVVFNDRKDPKFNATEDIEDLFEEKPEARAGRLRAAPEPGTESQPKKRTYRQGKI